MRETIMRNVVLPSLGRVGTGATGFLVGIGATTQHAEWVGTGIVGLGLISFDLLSSWLLRKMRERKE